MKFRINCFRVFAIASFKTYGESWSLFNICESWVACLMLLNLRILLAFDYDL